jgi:hypothetical protein
MDYLRRPKLKDAPPLPLRKGKRCTHKGHGQEDVWPDCGARFSKTWWAKYYVNRKAIRESTETEKETEARRFLKTEEGAAATGQAPLPVWIGSSTRRRPTICGCITAPQANAT